MVDKLEERIEQMIDEKLGLYEPKNKGRRTANEIRDQIQEELGKRPKTTHELSKAVNATRSTIQNHCKHLSRLEIIHKEKIEEDEYWKTI